MLVLWHLFVGAAIGLAFAGATGDRRLFAVGLAAGILADLIDKPLRHLLLAFVLVLFAAGLPLFRRRRTLLAPVFALGVPSHHLLDAMWRDAEA